MASPLRSLGSRSVVSLGSAVTPRSTASVAAAGAALARAASNHSLHSVHSVSSVGGRTPKTPRTPRTPKTPNSAFDGPLSPTVAFAAARAQEAPNAFGYSGEPASPERLMQQRQRHHPELPILLGQPPSQAEKEPEATQPQEESHRNVRFQASLDYLAHSTRQAVMERQRARKERREMVEKARAALAYA
eukprot:s2_g73.t1